MTQQHAHPNLVSAVRSDHSGGASRASCSSSNVSTPEYCALEQAEAGHCQARQAHPGQPQRNFAQATFITPECTAAQAAWQYRPPGCSSAAPRARGSSSWLRLCCTPWRGCPYTPSACQPCTLTAAPGQPLLCTHLPHPNTAFCLVRWQASRLLAALWPTIKLARGSSPQVVDQGVPEVPAQQQAGWVGQPSCMHLSMLAFLHKMRNVSSI